MDDSLRTLLGVAVLLPLASFFAIWIFANWLGKSAAYIAVSAIGVAGLLSFISLFIWLNHHWPTDVSHHEAHETHGASPSDKHGASLIAPRLPLLARSAVPGDTLPLTLVAIQ